MRERRAVLDAISEAHRLGETVVLATVVRTRGSTYRRPGARLALLRDGRRVGTISGGCLESDLGKKAWWLTRNGPVLTTYDTLDDDDDTAGYRMGCRGVVDIFLERVEPGAVKDDLKALRRSVERGEGALVATVFESHEKAGFSAGDRLVPDDAEPPADRLPTEATEAIGAARADGRSRSVTFDRNGGRVGLFLEVVRPPIRVVLFGSGPDAAPVARLARDLGWSVTVVDRRLGRLSRIDAADQFLAGPIAEVAPQIGLDRSSHVVVMSHDSCYDRDALRAALGSDAPYIGVLGPRRRTRSLLDQLAGDGMAITDAMTGRIHSPIGLDLGADAPEEIALAIVAEIQTATAGRSGGSLRDRPGTIHERPDAAPRTIGATLMAARGPGGS